MSIYYKYYSSTNKVFDAIENDKWVQDVLKTNVGIEYLNNKETLDSLLNN